MIATKDVSTSIKDYAAGSWSTQISAYFSMMTEWMSDWSKVERKFGKDFSIESFNARIAGIDNASAKDDLALFKDLNKIWVGFALDGNAKDYFSSMQTVSVRHALNSLEVVTPISEEASYLSALVNEEYAYFYSTRTDKETLYMDALEKAKFNAAVSKHKELFDDFNTKKYVAGYGSIDAAWTVRDDARRNAFTNDAIWDTGRTTILSYVSRPSDALHQHTTANEDKQKEEKGKTTDIGGPSNDLSYKNSKDFTSVDMSSAKSNTTTGAALFPPPPMPAGMDFNSTAKQDAIGSRPVTQVDLGEEAIRSNSVDAITHSPLKRASGVFYTGEMKLTYFGNTASHAVELKNNEDAFEVYTDKEQGAFYIVADGVGGSYNGGLASRLAVSKFVERLAAAKKSGEAVAPEKIIETIVFEDFSSDALQGFLKSSIESKLSESSGTNLAPYVREYFKSKEGHQTATTFSVLWVRGDMADVYTIGDSPVYLVKSENAGKDTSIRTLYDDQKGGSHGHFTNWIGCKFDENYKPIGIKSSSIAHFRYHYGTDISDGDMVLIGTDGIDKRLSRLGLSGAQNSVKELHGIVDVIKSGDEYAEGRASTEKRIIEAMASGDPMELVGLFFPYSEDPEHGAEAKYDTPFNKRDQEKQNRTIDYCAVDSVAISDDVTAIAVKFSAKQ